MRRNLALPLAALLGAASAAPLSLAATSAAQSTPDSAAGQERYGVVRYDTSVRRWTIAATPDLRSSGLTGVSCSPATGRLTVTLTPLDAVGTFTVDEDDAYTGRYAAGAAVTADRMTITFRRAAGGAVVSCAAAELRIAGSSLQLWVRGTAGDAPAAPATTWPTTLAPSPSWTRPTVTPPPIDPQPTDPADTDPVPPPIDPGDTEEAAPPGAAGQPRP